MGRCGARSWGVTVLGVMILVFRATFFVVRCQALVRLPFPVHCINQAPSGCYLCTAWSWSWGRCNRSLAGGVLHGARRDAVNTRVGFALAGVLSVMLAILSSFGFAMFLGVPFTIVTQTLPFIILAIGVDGASPYQASDPRSCQCVDDSMPPNCLLPLRASSRCCPFSRGCARCSLEVLRPKICPKVDSNAK